MAEKYKEKGAKGARPRSHWDEPEDKALVKKMVKKEALKPKGARRKG